MHRFARIAVQFAALLSLSAALAAHAQTVQVYATAAPTYLTRLYTVNGSGATTSSDYSGVWFVPPNAGFTLSSTKPGAVNWGLDFRGGPKLGTPGLGSFLVGAKMSVKPTAFHLKPYGQLSIGYLDQSHKTGSGASQVTSSQSYLGVELLGGVDYPVAHHFEIRIVEIGVGFTHYGVSTGSNTSPNPAILSLQSGLVWTH